MSYPTNPDATAFPLSGAAQFTAQFSNLSGLTKREYFAAAALFGLAHQSAEDLTVAKAVRLADALIQALNQASPASPETNEPPF